MFYFKYLKKELHYFLIEHKSTRFVIESGTTLFLCILSAFFFALGFRCFISLGDSTLAVVGSNPNIIPHLATGGMSGVSQCIILFGQIFGLEVNYNLLQSIFYFILNIPLLVFSFWKLGFKFSFYTTLNVAFVSIFINFLPTGENVIFDQIGLFLADEPLARGIFAGIMTGLSSGIAFKANHSAGGVDIIAYYYSTKKSTSTGKYMSLLNGIIILTFTILSIFHHSNASVAIVTALFSISYLFFSSLVIDTINVRNKKVQLQIVTGNEQLAKVIVANVPHSCTIVKAKGGYTGNDKFIIYCVVSNSEVARLVHKIRISDPTSFINTVNLKQVYGRFFIRPID